MSQTEPKYENTIFDSSAAMSEPDVKWRETVRLFCANRAALLGFIFVCGFILVGVFGPIIMPADPFEMVAPPLVGPSSETYFGSDYLGRDVFIGIIHGARPTMIIALTATLVTVIIGLTIGAVAGFYGGMIDNMLMRVTEFFQVLPPLVFAMVIVAVFSSDIVVVILAIAVTTWPTEARLTRAEFLKIKENLAVKIIEIVENNEAGFAFPSQSLYVEKLSDEKTEIFNPQSTKN